MNKKNLLLGLAMVMALAAVGMANGVIGGNANSTSAEVCCCIEECPCCEDCVVDESCMVTCDVEMLKDCEPVSGCEVTSADAVGSTSAGACSIAACG